MLTFLRKKKREEERDWRALAINTLILAVLPKGTPYYYDTAFSFLQKNVVHLDDSIRVDLFIPDLDLFIDMILPSQDTDYRTARPYISRKDWEVVRERLAAKCSTLEKYYCRHLLIYHFESIDPHSLKERIRHLVPGASLLR